MMKILRMGPSRGVRLALCGWLIATAPALKSAEPVPVTEPSSSPSEKNLSSDLSRLAEAAVKDGRTAGISFTVRKGKTVLSEGAFGFADLENRVAAAVDTVYAIGSLTKQLTAAAVLLLADEGELSLDDPLGKFVPRFPEPGRNATVRQLLNHTSGIRSMTSLGPKYWAQAGREISPADLAALFASEPADFPAGTDYRYSNSGYVLLGLVVEKASGEPWGAFVTKRLIVPLGLSSTRDGETSDLVPRRARGFSRRKSGGFENAWSVNLTQGYAAGALLSTVGDLAAWTRRLHTEPPVSKSSYRAMTTPATLPNGKTLSYGYGLGVDSFGGHRRFFHGGGLPGFDGWAAFFPDDDVTVVALCNTDGDVAREVADAMSGLLLGAPDAKTRVPAR
ncbi:MAG: serine hydrolase domain-containing protein [Thermoanaerobaculia bacterium]